MPLGSVAFLKSR